MALPEPSWLTPESLPPGQGLGRILKATFRQYFKNGWQLTRPLLAPIVKITLGAYACLILNYLFIDSLIQSTAVWDAQNIGILGLGILIITLVTLYPFLNGFWQYIVYFASLNRNAMEAFAEQPIQIKPAYESVIKSNATAYQILLLAYVAIPILIMLFFALISWVVLIPQIGQNTFAVAASVFSMILLFVLAICLNLLITALFTFIFQITAFEKLPMNPLPVLMKSVQMVFSRWFSVFVLQIMLAVFTTLLAPSLIAMIFRLSWLSWPIDQLHIWLTHLILRGAAPVGDVASMMPGYGQLFQMLEGNTLLVATGLTDTVIATIVTAILLPVGTFAFSRLYWDIEFRHRAK